MTTGRGLRALKPKPSGGRKRENMTFTEEKALLARFAKAAGAGEMSNIHDLKAAYVLRSGLSALPRNLGRPRRSRARSHRCRVALRANHIVGDRATEAITTAFSVEPEQMIAIGVRLDAP